MSRVVSDAGGSGALDGMAPLDELAALLRPAGGGIHTVSTGRAVQQQLQRQLYGASDAAEVSRRWRADLDRLAQAKVVILGIPSDNGAGLVRGASFGPQELRLGLLKAHGALLAGFGSAVVDVGDVAVIPHLLHDDMVSEPQKQASRAALYPGLGPTAAGLPVSPLSIAERALERIFDVNPRARLLVLGGDHSVAWPVVAVLARRRAQRLGIVQPDAHTDLLPERLGVPICFATWAYHANQAIGGDGRLVQVGIRASGRPREHWESTLGVRQFWASEVAARGEAVIDDIVAHLRARKISQLYFSNDIDATDMAFAPATGAPEPDGLTPEFVIHLIERLGREFDLVGADLVEVAPPVGAANDSQKTVAVGVGYLAASLQALLGSTSS
jgi:arginase family enzyme